MGFTLVKEKTEKKATTGKKGELKKIVPSYYVNSFLSHNNLMNDKQALKLAVDLFSIDNDFIYDFENISGFVHGLSYEFDSDLGQFTAHFSFVGGYTLKGADRVELMPIFQGFKVYFDYAKYFQDFANKKYEAYELSLFDDPNMPF